MTNEELADLVKRLRDPERGGGSDSREAADVIEALLRQSATVRALAIGEAAKVCDRVAAAIKGYAEQYKNEGREQDMYRANTAWHNVVGIAEQIRSLSPTPDLEAMVERGNHGFEPCPGCQGQPVMRIVEAEISIDCPRKECAVEQSPFFRSADIAIRSWNQYAIAERRLAAPNQQKDETQ